MRFSSWLRNGTSNAVTRKGARRRAAPPHFRPRLEALEDRVVPSTLTVNSAADSGAGAAGRNGDNGGDFFNDGLSPFGTPSLTLLNCAVLFNEADGGAAGSGGREGQGFGGGVFNLGTFLFDLATEIASNNASTNGDDVLP